MIAKHVNNIFTIGCLIGKHVNYMITIGCLIVKRVNNIITIGCLIVKHVNNIITIGCLFVNYTFLLVGLLNRRLLGSKKRGKFGSRPFHDLMRISGISIFAASVVLVRNKCDKYTSEKYTLE